MPHTRAAARSLRPLCSAFASSLSSHPLCSSSLLRPSLLSASSCSSSSSLSCSPVPLFLCPRRHFAKRLVTEGFAQTGAERRGKKRPTSGVAGRGADAGAGGAAAAASEGGDSIGAIEAENEERIRKALLPALTEAERRRVEAKQGRTFVGAAARDDGRSDEERVRDVLYHRRMNQRFTQRSRRWQFALHNKLRRRWEAINGLTAELRAFCTREDRRSLPPHMPLPVDCYGEEILVGQGLMGAQTMTEKQVKAYLDWQQEEKRKGRAY